MTRDIALLLLGLSPQASTDEVTRAFKVKTSEWHPDRHASDPAKNEAMRLLIEARDVLLGRTPESSANPVRPAAAPPPSPPPAPSEADHGRDPSRARARYDDFGYGQAYLEILARELGFGERRYGEDDRPGCRANTAQGYPCSARALPGNYGFCGRHRR
jgi:hypothetical protein